ncbi:TPR-like protein [Neocallimastix lanati (nom. inval.)]|jgi:FK506-binding protein 4/5|uniref:TPR-like protein n=1 Tax=Neocallimastix californiae TaxID=1754190 RepID=A0A1Y2EZW7_9FUNG|nr:TPR-like protein [Neocallimastix sp. JGI-2020a]ORY77158.1 TPR-like protein [Neocallimastix californiae]|eukprot:ORY77158.1 TPR-like protein [Neocallimastix californiae]
MNKQTLDDKRKKLDIGQENRLKGNKYFKEKDYKNALKCYHIALLYTTGLKSTYDFGPKIDDEKLNEDIDKCLISIYNNMALCLMKTAKYERAVQSCTKVLDIEDYNDKALYRRGRSYLALQKFDLAEKDLKKAANINSTDSGIKEALNQLKKEKVKYEKEKNEAMKKMSKKMFES